MQVAPDGFSRPILNEDCLYLNVVAPSDALLRKRKRAVMVWIHGGGLVEGRANDYDPTRLVEDGDVVFVSLTYRLNILGFLAHPALDKEGHDFANYGLMDQQFALSWVRRNIQAFGGDPSNITIFGESAGGSSVFNHMASPKSWTLFDKSIVQSGSMWNGDFSPSFDGVPLVDAERDGKAASDLLGCPDGSDASCLRAAPVESLAEVVKKLSPLYFGIVVDGRVMPKSTREAILSGDFKHVPIINGSNHDEWTWIEGTTEAATARRLTKDGMKEHLEAYFGRYAQKVVPYYQIENFGGSPGAAVAKAETDGLLVCPLLSVNGTLAKSTPVWGYEFNDVNAPFPFPEASFPYGAAHTLEIRYLFENYKGAVGQLKPLSTSQRALSRAMVSYWTTFAKTGNPNSTSTPEWPMLRDRYEQYLSLVPPQPKLISSAEIDKSHHCSSLWKATEGASSVWPIQ